MDANNGIEPHVGPYPRTNQIVLLERTPHDLCVKLDFITYLLQTFPSWRPHRKNGMVSLFSQGCPNLNHIGADVLDYNPVDLPTNHSLPPSLLRCISCFSCFFGAYTVV